MQLNVSVYRDGEKVTLSREVIAGFDDAEKIGMQVGRQVRDWLRERPVRQSGTRIRLDVHACWTNGPLAAPGEPIDEVEDQPPKPRKRKRRK
jgi:hypothetical protein